MKKIHISATLPTPIKEYKVTFSALNPRYASGTITLSPYGDYILSTRGITDGAARRLQAYKAAYKKVSTEMLHAYENNNRQYTSIHRKMKKVLAVETYEQELMALKPEKYKRGIVILPKPTKDEVENDLRIEAQALNFDKFQAEGHVDEAQFVKQNLNKLTEDRQRDWWEACNLFNQIEDAREERTNAHYFAEYKKKYDQKKSFIEGNPAIVEENIKNLCDAMEIPYNMELLYSYDQMCKTLVIKAVVENGFCLPMQKATILSSGKISIKNKLVKENINDRTNSVISLAYYLGSEFFVTSPNINYLQISLYSRNLQNPLLWVEFDRNSFTKLNPLTIDPVSHIVGYDHIIDFKVKSNTLDLVVMKSDEFERKVASMISSQSSEGIRSVYHFEEKGDGKIYVSMETAQKLLSIPVMEADVRKAIAMAKDYGNPKVVLDKKYKGLLSEFALNQ